MEVERAVTPTSNYTKMSNNPFMGFPFPKLHGETIDRPTTAVYTAILQVTNFQVITMYPKTVGFMLIKSQTTDVPFTLSGQVLFVPL